LGKNLYSFYDNRNKACFFLKHRRSAVVLVHLFVFAFAYFFSLCIMHNMSVSSRWLYQDYLVPLSFLLIVKTIVFWIFGQYRGWWRYVSISDLFGIYSASIISCIIIAFTWYVVMVVRPLHSLLMSFENITQGLIILDMIITIMALSALRLLIRLYHEDFKSKEAEDAVRLLIAGAGDAGEALAREILKSSLRKYKIVGFVDDSPQKRNISIHGYSVHGTIEDIPDICSSLDIDEIAIAMPSAPRAQIKRIIRTCEDVKKRCVTVPSITDIASGRLSVTQMRDVDIADLLGRDEVKLDTENIREFLNGKVILVTGAGGSIGSEMCRQICNFGPSTLLLLEQAENPLFFIDAELKKNFPNVQFRSIIADIVDRERLEHVFSRYKPEVIVHAAAHKHVPLMEANPGESFKNNVIGTKNLADMSDKYHASNFVMISTDKAVNPTSLMGSSKRIAEMYVQDLDSTSKTNFTTVRFGNVLGSNGSVIPIFKAQIEAGGPVTVTHPDMTRYFMTIPESSQLVLQAATMGTGGEIFLLDMGEPVKIVDLARELIRLSGFTPDDDIKIEFAGIRPGEKLYEELSIEGENMVQTRHPKIAIWKMKQIDRKVLYSYMDELFGVIHTQDHSKIVRVVKKLIPEYIGDRKITET
jgi:FlaA1/EpsC-like NDP-sugar epimerase